MRSTTSRPNTGSTAYDQSDRIDVLYDIASVPQDKGLRLTQDELIDDVQTSRGCIETMASPRWSRAHRVPLGGKEIRRWNPAGSRLTPNPKTQHLTISPADMQNPSDFATRATRKTTRFGVHDANCNAAGAMHRVAWALQESRRNRGKLGETHATNPI